MSAKRILLIEPDARFLSELADRLVAEGFLVCTAADFVQGLEDFNTHLPDLAIISLDLTGDSAFHLHEHINRVSRSTPVLYTDRGRGDGRRTRALDLGAREVLDCPAPMSTYVRAARRLLDDDRGADGARSRSRSLRVLVVDDDLLQRQLILACLEAPGRETVEATVAGSVAEAHRLIRSESFGCVLLDHRLPDGSGLDLLEKAEEELLTTPVIALSGDDRAETAVAYFRAGCTDYFIKREALCVEALRRNIAQVMSRFQRRALATLLDRQELGDAIVKSQEGLITLARTDGLMGICNRAVFDDFLPQFHEEHRDRGDRYAVCMIDVDRFKSYNDLHGHAAGDATLRRVAEALAGTLRDDDFIARYGGEELVVLLADVDDASVLATADRLRSTVEQCDIEHREGVGGRVTVSVGVGVSAADEPPASVLARADQALYDAKARGRNRVVVADNADLRRSA
ncbi:MAG: diguanylate cyclase [Planctomycetota bacterium]|jgi:two-component system cell cycle response regulator